MACAIVASSTSRACAVAIVLVILIQLSFGAELQVQRWKRQSCRKNTYQCKSGTCIDNFLLCDGRQDCDDRSDETTEACRDLTCPGLTFKCDYGACINSSGVCNGVKECADGSDESEKKCHLRATATTTSSKSSPSAGCMLPPQPENGQYRLGGCAPSVCHPIPGESVKIAFLSYSCNPGFVLTGSNILLCENGWSSSFPSCSRAACASLVDSSREIECKLNDKNVPCDKPMAPGTKARVQCSIFYTHVKEFSDFDTICQPNGQWSREVTSCIPMCGEANPVGVSFLSDGRGAKYGEFPWYAGIYRLVDDAYQQVCGGSIISEKVIVTAAHCFWNVGAGTIFDIKQFKIAVGKFYRNWNVKIEPFMQIPEIERLILHERFRGVERQWQDVALIVLKDRIHMTLAVRPVCMDFTKQYTRFFTPGKKGIVVGWGATEDNKQSYTLSTTTLPYVSMEDCEKTVPQSFLPFLTKDKFCAGYLNGTRVCCDNSGGGYATQMRDGKWYLMGLVTVGVPEERTDGSTIHQYTTFTKMSEYYQFIQDNYSK